MGTGYLPGVKSGRGVTLTPHPLLVPLVMKEYSYTSTPPMDRTAWTEPQCLYKGDLYLIFFTYMFRTRRVHLQEDGCTNRHGIICLHANCINSLVGIRRR